MDDNLKTTIVDQFKNTELGFFRIKRNLKIAHFSDEETETYLKQILVSTPLQYIETKGKNHYFKCPEYNAILTVNSRTFTIITAKKIEKSTPVL